MKQYLQSKLIFCLGLAVLINGCKKDKGSDDTPYLSEGYEFVIAAENQFFEFGKQTGFNPYEAIILLEAWAKTREEVASAGLIDSTNLRVRLKSGLLTGLQFNVLDENGKSILRGGGSGGALTAFKKQISCSNEITNKKVLIFSPKTDEFYDNGELEQVIDIFEESSDDYTVTFMDIGQCNIENIKTFRNYGLVFINTHGAVDGFLIDPISLGSANNGTGLRSPVTEQELKSWIVEVESQEVLDMLIDGRLYHGGYLNISKPAQTGDPWIWNWNVDLQRDGYYCLFLSSKGILSFPSLEETVIFGNFCYSGYDIDFEHEKLLINNPPIRKAFLSKNPITYYCYAFDNGGASRVINKFAKQMEIQVARALVSNGDSTGIAHLDTNGSEHIDPIHQVHLKQFANNNYCFGCGGRITDNRDGKEYNTVCIGNQVWMAENLDYDAPGSKCYNNDIAKCQIYGRLYDWHTVMQGAAATNANPSGVRGICPVGWHVPSLSEWQEMMQYFVTNSTNPDPAGALMSRDYWDAPNVANNSSGFGVLPGGWWQYDEPPWNPEGFYGLNDNAGIWTTTEGNFEPLIFAFDIPFKRTQNYLTYYGNEGNKLLAHSCRCVKD